MRDAIAGDLDKGRLTCVEDPETVAAFCVYGQLGVLFREDLSGNPEGGSDQEICIKSDILK